MSTVEEEPSPADAPASLALPKEKKKKSSPQDPDVDLMLEMKDLGDQAEAYNQKAIRLFEIGRYEEAQQMWQKAIRIIESSGAEEVVEEFIEAPSVEEEEDGGLLEEGGAAGPSGESAGRLEETAPADQDRQRQEAVEEIYKDAIDLYRSGDYDRAKERFEEVRWLVPGYRASDQYIAQIENELEYEDQMRPSPEEEESEQDEDHWQDVVEETEQRRRDELEQKAEALYQQAVGYFEEQSFKEAQTKFEETEVFYPGYKNTTRYLAQIEERLLEDQEVIRQEEALLEKKLLEKEESDFERAVRERELARMKGIQEKADALYEKAVELYKTGRYHDAKIRFEEVEVLFPDYKFTRKYIARVEQDTAREEKERLDQKQRQEALAGKKEMKEWQETVQAVDQSHERKLKDEAERIYQQARGYYARGDARKARLYFQEAGRTVPHYKSTDKYLARIDQDLVKARRQRLDRRYRWKVFIQKREEDRLRVTQAAQKEQDTEALRQKAEPLYLEAKDLYRRGDFAAAKQKFREVVQKVPDYKSSARFLERLDEDIRRQEQYKEKEAKRARGRKERIQQFLKERRDERSGRKRQWQKEGLGETLAHIKEVRQEKSEMKARALYEAGQAYYKDRLLEVAREKFLEIERILPDYKSTRKYLARIQSEIEGKEQAWSDEYWAKRRAAQAASARKAGGVASAEGPAGALTRAQEDFFKAIRSERLHQKPTQAPEIETVEPIVVPKGKEHLKTAPAEPLEAADVKQAPAEEGRAEQKETEPPLKKKKDGTADAQMKKAVEKAYKEALDYFNKKKFHSAELKIKEAESYLSDAALEGSFLKAQRAKLQKLRARIPTTDERRPKEEDAAAAMEEKSASKAVRKPVSVRVSDPAVDEALRAVEDQQAQVRREGERARESFKRKLEETYKEAVRLFKKKNFAEARALFVEIDGASPDYKKTRDYLEKIGRRSVPGTVPLKKTPAQDPAPKAPVQLKADIINEALDQWEAGK